MWTESSAILRHRQQESTAANGGRRGLGCVMGVPTLKRARHLRRRTARGGERLRSITWRQDLRLLMWSSVAYNGEAHYGRKNKYYVKQFATLRSFKEVESLNVPCVVDEALELEEQEQSEFAMKISNYANLALLGIKGD
ncbi:hypothetical protein GW17_00038187 [Ensete ventricosum]|nr:hypothetical protein GW17_00038187 [Ensete ventricosum]